MTLELDIDQQLLQKAAESLGVTDESEVVNKALAQVIGTIELSEKQPQPAKKSFGSDEWWKTIAEIDFPELTDEEWEEWKSQGSKAQPDKW